MKILSNPSPDSWKDLIKRPQMETSKLVGVVDKILSRVKQDGDNAIREITKQIDQVSIDQLLVSKIEINEAIDQLDPNLKNAIQVAAKNITAFHEAQRRDTMTVETMEGVTCWRKPIPISAVGIYIPGGSAPLFSTVLMLGIPAMLAGCKEIVLCTPPGKDGKINQAILFAASLVGATTICKVGGAQAIGAMAYGTESIPQVSKIFGPGNQYVTKAKQMVSEEGVAIDMPAGPSEVLIYADRTADPAFVAADLLSQAEHGPDSQVVLVTTPDTNVKAIQSELATQLSALPRKEIAEGALSNSLILQFESDLVAMNFINEYAPEHLIINTANADQLAESVINAGSVFLGGYTPESAGDYASGTNHTLPTSGYAKAYAGVSLESFVKFVTFQRITERGIRKIGPTIEIMAAAEMLDAHKNAVSVRLKSLN